MKMLNISPVSFGQFLDYDWAFNGVAKIQNFMLDRAIFVQFHFNQ
jgi:hypothetical protein